MVGQRCCAGGEGRELLEERVRQLPRSHVWPASRRLHCISPGVICIRVGRVQEIDTSFLFLTLRRASNYLFFSHWFDRPGCKKFNTIIAIRDNICAGRRWRESPSGIDPVEGVVHRAQFDLISGCCKGTHLVGPPNCCHDRPPKCFCIRSIKVGGDVHSPSS